MVMLNLPYPSTYGHQILPQWTSTYKAEWPFQHVVLWTHMRNYKHCIFTCRRPLGTKLTTVLTYERPHHLTHMRLWARDQSEFMWETKIIIVPLSHDLWSVNLVGCWIWEVGSEHKCLRSHRFLAVIANVARLPESSRALELQFEIL